MPSTSICGSWICQRSSGQGCWSSRLCSRCWRGWSYSWRTGPVKPGYLEESFPVSWISLEARPRSLGRICFYFLWQKVGLELLLWEVIMPRPNQVVWAGFTRYVVTHIIRAQWRWIRFWLVVGLIAWGIYFSVLVEELVSNQKGADFVSVWILWDRMTLHSLYLNRPQRPPLYGIYIILFLLCLTVFRFQPCLRDSQLLLMRHIW